MEQLIDQSNKTPGQPATAKGRYQDDESKSRDYVMHYRQGNNPNGVKGFTLNGTFREAYERAKQHCALMNYRLIMIRPMISDLDQDEKNRETGINI